MKVVSFFAGAGGLDLGFEQAGFDVVWANEYDKEIWSTYELNHKNTILDKRSIVDISSDEVPDCDGIIGGPPCQSWSEAGSKRGITDKRGQLKLSFELLNVADFGVPQDRKRVFFVGYREDLGKRFEFPKPITPIDKITLAQAIGDLSENVLPAKDGNLTNGADCKVLNHEYMTGGFSSIYMSRNRVRSWDEVSFTIQAGGRHAPLHPQAPKMKFVEQNIREFIKGQEHLYRRLSIRECARIQTFPDNFFFDYKKVSAAYKMIGNGKNLSRKNL